MNPSALLANTLWGLSNFRPYWRFQRALQRPEATQRRWLEGFLRTNADTAFGKAFHFCSISEYEQFKTRIPIGDYQSFEPWITKIREGVPNVLTQDRVTHLVPTSGSSGARKLIPFTRGLQRDFDAAIGPWIFDLQVHFPSVLAGPAYWSITPAFEPTTFESSAVPIGFESDSEYLGKGKAWLSRMAMVRPPVCAGSLADFRRQTLLHLLRCPDLRLISVWHPSFFTLLLDDLPNHWAWLMDQMALVDRNRRRKLSRADPSEPTHLWPELRLISCWGEGAAEAGIRHLEGKFPRATVQRKGLLATEGVVTIPFAGEHVLAVRSHFFEFIDSQGSARLAHELQQGEEYEVVLTTGGGLCRYRLGDRVKVTGQCGLTPCLRFLGKARGISDLCGEKLSESFVSAVLRELLQDSSRFALLAPETEGRVPYYTLYLEGPFESEREVRLDELLKANPQYALCRKLGQLDAPRIFLITRGGYEAFTMRAVAQGASLGEIKPVSLSTQSGWAGHFAGQYRDRLEACQR